MLPLTASRSCNLALDRPAARACKPARRCIKARIKVLAFTKEDEAVVKGMIRDELDSYLRTSAARFDQLTADVQELTADVQELKLGVKLVQSDLKLGQLDLNLQIQAAKVSRSKELQEFKDSFSKQLQEFKDSRSKQLQEFKDSNSKDLQEAKDSLKNIDWQVKLLLILNVLAMGAPVLPYLEKWLAK